MRRVWTCCIVGLAIVGLGGVVPAQETYRWDLPRGLPPPAVPVDNPMSQAKVTLGRYLFYDSRLSGNGTQSCATCHEQARAFTGGWAAWQAAGLPIERKSGFEL